MRASLKVYMLIDWQLISWFSLLQPNKGGNWLVTINTSKTKLDTFNYPRVDLKLSEMMWNSFTLYEAPFFERVLGFKFPIPQKETHTYESFLEMFENGGTLYRSIKTLDPPGMVYLHKSHRSLSHYKYGGNISHILKCHICGDSNLRQVTIVFSCS